MMLAKLLICSSLIFLTRGTFITLQKCTTRTQCTDNGKAPNATQQTISLERNTLIPGKAGPKGLKGDQGERGRDCNEAKFNTEITQIKSIVKYNIAALDKVTAKNEADITLCHNNIAALERVTAKNEADITLSQNTIKVLERVTAKSEGDITLCHNNFEALERVTAKNEADITNSQNEIEIVKRVTTKNEAELHDQVEDLKTQLNETQINLNQSNERIRTLNDDLNETKNELSSAQDKITRLEVKMQMLISATTIPVSPTTVTTATVTTAPKTILSDEDRVKVCGLIHNIPDGAITASSVYDDGDDPVYGPRHSRLFSTSGGGSWLPNYYVGSWIQIEFETDVKIRGVATQGNGRSGVATYSISFKTSTSSSFQNIEDQSGAKKIFEGNTVRNTAVINDLDITARYIRIYPLTWFIHPMLRFDMLTC